MYVSTIERTSTSRSFRVLPGNDFLWLRMIFISWYYYLFIIIIIIAYIVCDNGIFYMILSIKLKFGNFLRHFIKNLVIISPRDFLHVLYWWYPELLLWWLIIFCLIFFYIFTFYFSVRQFFFHFFHFRYLFVHLLQACRFSTLFIFFSFFSHS